MKKVFLAFTGIIFSVIVLAGNKSIPKVNDYKLTSTGQTDLYGKDGEVLSNIKESDSFYGQDANYSEKASMGYTDNGDGTITDNVTGLMWQQIPIKKGMTWSEAEKYCEKLKLAGYKDWRMPNIKELFSLSNFKEGWPYINTDFFKLVQNELTKDEQYWSSNKYVGLAIGQNGPNSQNGQSGQNSNIRPPQSGNMGGGQRMGPPPGGASGQRGDQHGSQFGGQRGSQFGGQRGGMGSMNQSSGKLDNKNQAFGVNFATGHIKAYPAQAKGPIGGKYIRAVRGSVYGTNNYKDNLDGTITDSNTKLMWAKSDSKVKMNWEQALKYAQNCKIGGYTDWRLPNVKELQSIVDYNYSPTAKKEENKGAAINKIFSCTPIVNEAKKSDYGYYWSSTSARFRKNGVMSYAWYVAFGSAVDNKGVDTHGAGAVRFDTKYEGGNKGEGGERYYNMVRLVRNVK